MKCEITWNLARSGLKIISENLSFMTEFNFKSYTIFKIYDYNLKLYLKHFVWDHLFSRSGLYLKNGNSISSTYVVHYSKLGYTFLKSCKTSYRYFQTLNSIEIAFYNGRHKTMLLKTTTMYYVYVANIVHGSRYCVLCLLHKHSTW